MKKTGSMIVSLVLALSIMLGGCGKAKDESKPEEITPAVEASTTEESPAEPAEQTEIYLLAAASLTDVFNEIITEFEAEHPEYKVIPTYEASGSLQTKIEEGAPADLFFSAAQKQMDALKEQELVVADTEIPFLENKVVLIVPENSDKEITGFEDLATDKVEHIALGDFESVPVGQYSKEILTNLNLLDQVQDKIAFAEDVRAVLAWVEGEEADCGMVYSTDAKISTGVKVVAEAPEGSVKPVIYPVAALSNAQNMDGAMVFLEYFTQNAGAKFESYGFSLVK